jgi:hypothetical protein
MTLSKLRSGQLPFLGLVGNQQSECQHGPELDGVAIPENLTRGIASETPRVRLSSQNPGKRHNLSY